MGCGLCRMTAPRVSGRPSFLRSAIPRESFFIAVVPLVMTYPEHQSDYLAASAERHTHNFQYRQNIGNSTLNSGNPSRLIFGEQLGRGSASRLILEIDIGERLSAVVRLRAKRRDRSAARLGRKSC